MKQTSLKRSVRLAAVTTMAVLAMTAGLSACKTQTAVTNNVAVAEVQKPQPVNMILDADFGSSTDDLFALMMLNHYIDEGLVNLKGIVVDREGEKNAALVDVFNTYYGHPDVPVGLERNGVKNPRCFIPYSGICDLKNAQGEPLFKRSFDTKDCPDGYKLYRRLLSQADDKSIVIVAIGFATTLSQLMQSGGDELSPLSGLELFEKKVKSVYIQSGRFELGDSLSGYNMRAASRQSAIFYDNLPKSVDLIMSPSNIGDKMDYLPGDVLTDLSDTEYNPIKAVYSNYTCDTGQRMWDTNCLVNAVLGDEQYHLSPRGWVTFVDRGEESLLLFKPDPQGNARYQVPGDSYFFEEKLMDIRRHTRINRYPSAYTIESPQPLLTGSEALAWAKPRVGQLMDKYLCTAHNTLDPIEVREVFRPIGYYGGNGADYAEAEKLVVDSLYTVMLRRAIAGGKRSLAIVTGPPASGKSTAARELKLSEAGLIYDAALTEPNALQAAIAKAQREGMEKVTVLMVYNDLLTCFKNSVNRGLRNRNFTAVDEMVSAFLSGKGKLEQLRKDYPGVEIVPVDCSNNQGVHRVSIAEAQKWNHDVSEADMNSLLAYLLNEINSGELQAYMLPSVAGNIMATPGLSGKNAELAKEIQQKVIELTKEYKVR